jgi:tetratricopeptide (TPR) repeat protein
MTGSFSEHFERGCRAQDQHDNAQALVAFEVALAIAEAPHERALALNGLADIYFRNEQDDRAFELMDQAIAACLPRPDAAAPTDARVAHALAEVWRDKGARLTMLNRGEEALAVFDESLGRFLDRVTADAPRDGSSRKLRLAIVLTLRTKISALDGMERLQEAMECCDDLIRRFQAVEDSDIVRRVARTMCRRACFLGWLGRQDKEIAGYDEIVERFGGSDDPDLTEIVLDALERKMRIYRDQEDLEMVVEICEQIINRYKSDTHRRTADTVARMMIRQAVALGKRGDHAKELSNYDEVVRLHAGSAEPMLRTHAAKALMFKAVTLNDADQSAAEMECYEEVLQRFAEDIDDEVRAVAADALIHKGISLGAIAEDAAEDTGVREIEAEIACYDEVVKRYGEDDSIHLKRAVAEALLHKGETLLEAGRVGGASACLDGIIAAYAAIDDRDLEEIVKDARELKAQI